MGLVILTSIACLLAAEGGNPIGLADAVFVNGKIWTGNPQQPEAEAIAVWKGRIIGVGSKRDMETLRGPNCKVIDFKGNRVVPGFFDSHLHLLGSGQRLSQVSLKDAADLQEFGRRLREFDAKLPRDRWLMGGDWDHDRALGGKLPDAALIDQFVPNRPVFLRRYDGHMAVVNSATLRLAGINADTREVAGGVIYRNQGTKEPSGVLRDNAMGLVSRLIPPPSETEIVEAVRAALAEIRENGITSVQDMDGTDPATRRKLFHLYQDLARAGELTARVDLRWPLAQWQELANLGIEGGFGNDWIRIGGLKGFMDGSLGSNTARMFESFLNEAGSTGVNVTPLRQMREYVLAADRAGLSVAVHAIGDRANAELLDIYEEVRKTNGPRDRRFRIEHAQHLRPEDYGRFAKIGVIASMQPYHCIDDGRWAEGRIGKKRCVSSYAYRSLLDADARLAFGSDWSVAPLSVMQGIDAAVNRRTLDGKNPQGWFPEQRITVAEALKAYTLDAAYAAFEERDRGSIEPGKLADFVLLSRDILDPAEREHLEKTRVLQTVVGGKVVYSQLNND